MQKEIKIYSTVTGGRKIGLSSSTMQQYHRNHNIGTKIGPRNICFTEKDLDNICRLRNKRWSKS